MTQWILTSCILIAAVLLIRFVGRDKLSAWVRYALWALVLLRLLIPGGVGATSLSVLNYVPETDVAREVHRAPTYDIQQNQTSEPSDLLVASDITDTSDVSVPSDTSQTTQTAQATQPSESTVQGEATRQSERTVNASSIFMMLWAAGMVLAGSAFFISNLRFAAKLRRSRRYLDTQTVPIYETAAIETPCLFGFLQPAVYVTPEVFADEDALRHVLAHELTHYRHKDHIWSLLRCVCVTLHWYNPLVWAAAYISQQDAELACDEGALKRIGEEERTAYARTLLDLTCVGYKGMLTTATSMTGSDSDLKQRVLRIVKNPKMPKIAIPIVLVLVLLIGLVVFTGEERGLEGLWRSEDLRHYEREHYVTDSGSMWDDNWNVETYEELDFRGDTVRKVWYWNKQASGISYYTYTLEDDQILIETDSYSLDGTPYIITYTWDRQKNTLSYYNERYDYTYTLYPCEQTDNGLLPYGMDINHVINGEQMTDFRYQDSSSLLLDAIRTSEVERVSAPMPQSPDYEIHFTCDGDKGVCYVADELFYMDGNAYRLSKMPLVMQALRGMNWISNQPLTDAQGRVYYTHPQPEICEVSMWYGENRYYVFDRQAELEAELENIRPYAVEERPELSMEEMDNIIAVNLSEYILHVYPCGWVYDSENDVYFPAEYTAGVCALLEPYRFVVEDFRAASALQGSWEVVRGGNSAADMTVYYLSAGNGIGSRTTYYEEGKQTEQFVLEAADDRLVLTFADGTRKTYSYAVEGSVLTLTGESETLVLESLQTTLYESYRENFDIIRRRSGNTIEPLSMTDDQKQQLTALLQAGIPDEQTDENIIYSDECIYDLYGITLPGVKSNITLSDRGKVFFDGENYLLTNADAVLDYINGVYAEQNGYAVTNVYISSGYGVDEAEPLLAEVGQRVVLDAVAEPKGTYMTDAYEWSISDESICELRFEDAACWVTGKQTGSVTVTLRCGDFTDTVTIVFVDEW
ncbi:MAG: hypothetical protein IJD81_11155 [Oscillospiraceae bacterium]|nr:hypothetical protein [Oscillospiraceae bacterium]